METGRLVFRLEPRRGDSAAWLWLFLVEFEVVRGLHVGHFSVGLDKGSWRGSVRTGTSAMERDCGDDGASLSLLQRQMARLCRY